MSTLPEGITQADIDRLAKLDAGIKKLTAEAKEIKERLKESLPLKTATYSFENVVVKATKTDGQMDKKVAEATFPYSQNPEFYTPTIDPKKLKSELGEAVKDFYSPSINLSVSLAD